MLRFEIASPRELTDDVLHLFEADSAVSSLAVLRGASIQPPGDVVVADVAREAANDVVERLQALGVHHQGTVRIEPVQTWLSRTAYEAEQRTPGASADAVVWAEVAARAYDDAELNWTYLSFITLATLIAGVAIVLDSQILVIGAMVLGPEFGAIAALGVAVVRRRAALFGMALRTLVVGFALAMAVTAAAALAGRALGWVTRANVTSDRAGTAFIYAPDKWSVIVAVIAAAAGVLSLTSSRVGGLSGVFISVTTIPAAGNVALATAFGVWDEVTGSLLQLAVNLSGMTVAGWLTLALQEAVWSRVSLRRARLAGARPPGLNA